LKCFYATTISHYTQQITNNEDKAMDSIPQITEEFLSKLRELNEFYKLFSSFNDEDIPADRREIILDNLTCQMLLAETEFTQKCIRS
jgi:hypothetical protein